METTWHRVRRACLPLISRVTAMSTHPSSSIHFPAAGTLDSRAIVWRLVLVALIAVSLTSASLAADPKAAVVRLVVNFNDGAEVHFTGIKWHDGLTVLDALGAAQMHPHGVTFSQRGSGSTAMIFKIGDLKNQGSGKNWIYYLNDKPGEVSAGVQKLKAGDAVLWKFEEYDYNR